MTGPDRPEDAQAPDDEPADEERDDGKADSEDTWYDV